MHYASRPFFIISFVDESENIEGRRGWVGGWVGELRLEERKSFLPTPLMMGFEIILTIQF